MLSIQYDKKTQFTNSDWKKSFFQNDLIIQLWCKRTRFYFLTDKGNNSKFFSTMTHTFEGELPKATCVQISATSALSLLRKWESRMLDFGPQGSVK